MAEPIKETQIVQAKRMVIDEENFIPPDLDDPRISRKDKFNSDSDQAGVSNINVIIGPVINEPPYEPIIDPNLLAPDEFWIVSQTVRSVPGGGQVVDVLVETIDKPGVVEYEVRITKPAGQL